MNDQQSIYEEAIRRIQARRAAAQQEQERRSAQIRQDIPETVELDRQLHAATFALLQAASGADSAANVRSVTQQCMEANKLFQQLLTAHGYPADYLDTHYSCKDCDDTGFVGAKPCKCLEREVGKVGAERLNAHAQLALCSFETFSLSYYRDLPQEQYQTMAHIFRECRDYAAHFDPHASPNILMIGATGLGKTHLSLSIASAVLEQGFTVVYDSVGNLMNLLEDEHFRRGKADRPQDDTMQSLMSCDLLILDDFGTEFQTSFTDSAVYLIINSRMNAGKPMIINTNLVRGDLQKRYGSRILSRLSAARIMQFYGKDIRFQKRFRPSGG